MGVGCWAGRGVTPAVPVEGAGGPGQGGGCGSGSGEGNLGTSPRLLVGETEKEQSRGMSDSSLSSWGDGVPKDREVREEATRGAETGNRVEEGDVPA